MGDPQTARARLVSARDVVAAGLAAPADEAALEEVARRYAVAITPHLADRITAGGTDGALARQYVPQAAELQTAPHERADPIGDAIHSPLKGLVHRYRDRVLLMPTTACAVYCRYCFRREQVGGGTPGLNAEEIAAALDYIRKNPAIWEVILTGGDPLILAPRRLAALIEALAGIDHLGVIRVHSRVPMADPDRVSEALVAALRAGIDGGKAVWMAVHANHADEFTGAVPAALARLADAGMPLLGQSVLLRGVNDTPEALEALMRAFVRHRVKPYYLHQLDPAPGTAGFHVPLETGQRLVDGLRGPVSGLCQPVYMLDLPGGHGKAPLTPSRLRHGTSGGVEAQGQDGRWHALKP